MNIRRKIIPLALTSFAVGVGVAIFGTLTPVAGSREDIVGSWILRSESLIFPGGKRIASWGDHPFGFMTFDGAGNFSQMLMRSDLPQFATRGGGSREDNDAVAKGAIAYYGTYKVDLAGSAVDVHIIGSSFAAFNGTESRRNFKFTGPDELQTTNVIPGSGVTAELVWQRSLPTTAKHD